MEQQHGHEAVLASTSGMREVSVQVRATIEEQTLGMENVREGSELVRESVDRIGTRLQEQSRACGQAADFLERVSEETSANKELVNRIGHAMRELRAEADRLREGVLRFRI